MYQKCMSIGQEERSAARGILVIQGISKSETTGGNGIRSGTLWWEKKEKARGSARVERNADTWLDCEVQLLRNSKRALLREGRTAWVGQR